MNNFDYVKFDKTFDTKIYPKLLQFEKERKKTLFEIFITLCIFTYFWIFLYLYISSNGSETIISGLYASIITFISCTMIVSLLVWFFRKSVKKKLYKQLFHSIGFKYVTSLQDAEADVNYICKISKLFNKYGVAGVDDKIIGKYKDLEFSVLDTRIYSAQKISDEEYERILNRTIFKGIILTTKIMKPLKCNILIKTNKFVKDKNIPGMELVNLEDVEFERYFDVYSDNQVEARYILTTAFMNRLLEYRKSKHINSVEVVINSNISDDENIFFFINNNKNNFEVPIFRTILNKKIFINILKDFTDAIDVINELKLEQNIGL